MRRRDSWWLIAGLTLSSAVAGCRDEGAARCAEDRRAVQTVIDADQRVSRMLHEADGLALEGKPLEAAKHLDQGARPAMDQVVTDARRLSPRTKWGASRKDEVVALTADRLELLDGYVEALRAENLERVLAEMEKQRDLEKRAVEVKRRVSETPKADVCGPL